MRFWLIVFQLTGLCLLVTAITCMAEVVFSTPGLASGLTGYVSLMAIIDIILLSAVGASQLVAFAAAVSTVAQPFLIAFVVSFGCAFLAGYKRLQWLKWVGFIVNLIAAIGWFFFTQATLAGVVVWGFYLICAALFLLMARKQDAEGIRRSVAVLHPLLWIVGLGCWYAACHSISALSLILTAGFYAIPFFLHYKITRSIALGMKSLATSAVLLALTMISMLVFLFVRTGLVGPLLLSWLVVLFFAETLFLSSRTPDVSNDSLGARSRRAIKIVEIMVGIVALIIGGATSYFLYIESKLPSAGELKSTEGIQRALNLNEE